MAKNQNKTPKAPPTKPDDTQPKVSDAIVEIGKDILAANPDMVVVYMTSDGRGFYNENDAANHARTLTNMVVTPVTQ